MPFPGKREVKFSNATPPKNPLQKTRLGINRDRVTSKPVSSAVRSQPLSTSNNPENKPGPSQTHKKADTKGSEDAFMHELLAGLDASDFDFDWVPSPPPKLAEKPATRLPQASLDLPFKEKRQRPIDIKIEDVRPPTKRLKPLSPKKTIFSNDKQSPCHAPGGAQSKSIKFALKPTVIKKENVKCQSPVPVPKVEPSRIGNERQPLSVKREASPVRVRSPGRTAVDSIVDKKATSVIHDDDLYDFDFDIADLDYNEDELLAQAPPPKIKYPTINPAVPRAPLGYSPTPWSRCVVDAVFGGSYFANGVVPPKEELENMELPEDSSFAKTLLVTLVDGGARGVVHLRGRWADTPVKKADIINIVSPSLSKSGQNPIPKPIEISFKESSSYLIHHPDLMLTMTSIANAMPCPRKPIVQALIKTPAPSTKPLLYGNLLHTLLQGALREQDFNAGGTFKRLSAELKKDEVRLEIWGTGMGVQDVKDEVGFKAGRGFEVFGDKWVHAEPRPEGDLHTTMGDIPSLLSISGLHEVEEDIWSPKWGLKGKVDASVQAKIIRDPKKGDVDENVAPLEIKTGRAMGVMAHRAQTMLYTLLMEDRYGVPVPAGLLYYSQLDTILRVEAKSNEVRALIMARNELASWLAVKRRVPRSLPENGITEILRGGQAKKDVNPEMKDLVEEVEEPFLPATIDSPRDCKSCYAVDACMLYRKTADGVTHNEETDPIAEIYTEKTAHMTDKHAEFYRKWDTLLTVEEQDTVKFRSQLWTMTAKQRQKNGRCFSDMIIESYSNDLGKSTSKIHRHSYTFIRAPSSDESSPSDRQSLLSGHIAKGDPVSLSIEPDLLCLWRGFVTELTQASITVGVTYVINTDALLKRTGREHRVLKASDDSGTGGQVVFRIDKDEMAGGMLRMRNNLAQLFYKDGDVERRRLIVDQEAPSFEPSWLPVPEEIPASLNSDQRKAMEAVLTARDYSLILGMPGTGKTTTIAEIIKALVNRGKTVLLTSYTHSAVDTILMKLADAEFGVLRLGNIDKVHPDVRHLTLEAHEPSASMAQMDARLMSPPVVAATCLAIDHPLFFRRKFDYCIVDEASQITLPTCIGPLRMAETFVLVGDHYQLPPIVRHPEARRGGLDVSLFRHLSSAHPQAVVDLSFQYRMNSDIMALSNKLVYEGRLKCGNEQVARQGLQLPHRKTCQEIYGEADCACVDGNCWVQELMDENAKCVFVDTDGLPAVDSKVGDLVQNEVEAKLVQQVLTALVASGIKQEDLAVITPYRQQIKLLTSCLKPLPQIEILTADKSQGRDKDCILVSLVRSNDHGSIGDLLKDWRRINVSFTRAKKKLIIFASARTLNADPMLKEFLQLVRAHGWEKKLRRGDDELHLVQVPVTQVEVKEEKRERKVASGGKGVLNGRGAFTKEIMNLNDS